MRIVSERRLGEVLAALPGIPRVVGHDASAQAEQIISQVAHPRARDGLRDAGRALGFRI